MEPAVPIIQYLWDARNTWLKHSDDCLCDFESLAMRALVEHFPASLWAEVVVTDDGPIMVSLYHTRDEWSHILGPHAQIEALQADIAVLTNEMADRMQAQAKYEALING